ncbi:hypothetical protein B0533_12905 [Sedimentibacter sp. SX930]|nr:hypothetical protein B0533_12905 [Sedimentibacter sp. SX930]
MEKLEEVYNKNYDLYILLNSFAINGTHFKTENYYLNLIESKYSCSRTKPSEIFSELKEWFSKQIYYRCDEETLRAAILDAKCEHCEELIKEHEYYYMYKFNKVSEIIELNKKLLEKYFTAKSLAVINDLKQNYSKIVPFIGAGISKDLGYPLWLEMFLEAKKWMDPKYHAMLELHYDNGDVDRMLDTIMTTSSLDTVKKIKQDLILPQIRRFNIETDVRTALAFFILKLNRPYIITTNYDDILEKISSNFKLGYETKNLVTFSGFHQLQKSKFIFHIHGDINMPDTMIVTNSDYEELYEKDTNKRILTSLIMDSSLLFMGFSLKDEYFKEEFNNICSANKDYSKNYMVGIENDQLDKLVVENISIISIKTESIGKNRYDSNEQYRFLLDFIDNQLISVTDKFEKMR